MLLMKLVVCAIRKASCKQQHSKEKKVDKFREKCNSCVKLGMWRPTGCGIRLRTEEATLVQVQE